MALIAVATLGIGTGTSCVGSDDAPEETITVSHVDPIEPQCPVCDPGTLCPDECNTSYCGDGWCDWNESCSTCEWDCGICWDPNIINVPGTPPLGTRAELENLAHQLGVSPMVAGTPNIVNWMNQPQTLALYPTGASSVQDFMNKLFQSGQWANTAPAESMTPLAPDANGCQLKRIDATYNPEDLVSFDSGAGLLFPSALAQGQYVNLGVGALIPLHVPFTQRNPVRLVSDFYASATSPTSTASDVYGTIGGLIQAANASGGITQSKVYFDMKTASSLQEAAAKFKLDAKLFGGSIGATFSSATTAQSNTVFVRFTQSLFTVFQDLQGYTPTGAQFNGAMTVGDLENLGATGELGYNNLPTYVRAVTYGRMLIFSVTSTSSKQELEEAVNAVYGKVNVQASASQKKLVQDSQLRVFSYGGPADPAISVIKSGNWQDYFTLVNVPLATLKPLGYEVRRFDDVLATMSRTTSYTERTCPGARKIVVRVSDAYKTAKISIKKAGAVNFDLVSSFNGYAEFEINQFLTGSTDQIKLAVDVGKTSIFDNSHGHARFELIVDGVPMVNWWFSCNSCHSRDPVVVFTVNQFAQNINDSVVQTYPQP